MGAALREKKKKERKVKKQQKEKSFIAKMIRSKCGVQKVRGTIKTYDSSFFFLFFLVVSNCR
jgi:hypothetical protein